jgi:hypothetical protein
MKLLLTTLFLLASVASIYGQRKLIVINPGQDILTNIPKDDLYAYRQFVDGSIHYRNGKAVNQKMNYNVLLSQMQYINTRGDTVPIGDYYFKFIVLEKDTFYYNNFFYTIIKEYDKIKLISRNIFVFVNRKITGPDSFYDIDEAVLTGVYLRGMAPKDTFRLARSNMYFMTDLKDNIQSLRRENLIKLYPHRKKELLEFLSQHPVHSSDLSAIEKMLEIVTGKKI